jgi:hypothetical protein
MVRPIQVGGTMVIAQIKGKVFNFFSAALVIILFSTSANSASRCRRNSENKTQSELTLRQKAIECAKFCFAPVSGAVASGVSFLGLATSTCTAGVCPMIAATGTGGLLTVSSVSAALTAYLSSAGEACAEGISFECTGYVAVPVIIGGTAGFLVVKGYDKARKWYARQQKLETKRDIVPNEIAQFLPDPAVDEILNPQ